MQNGSKHLRLPLSYLKRFITQREHKNARTTDLKRFLTQIKCKMVQKETEKIPSLSRA